MISENREKILLTGNNLSIYDVEKVAVNGLQVSIAEESLEKIRKCRTFLEEKIASGKVVYGLNTGIGEFVEVPLSSEELIEFQENLIKSHAVGVGAPLSREVVRASILSRINCHCRGHSGQREEVTQFLVELLNRDITPVVPGQGSVSACGDLAPMAHIALVMIGEGEAYYRGERLSGGEALRRAGLSPIKLEARDGLAAINGANVVAGWSALLLAESMRWLRLTELSTAMVLEVLNANMSSFDPRLAELRPYVGVRESSERILKLTEGSQLLERGGKRVQDAYSLRSSAQVIGAAWDLWRDAVRQVEIELNSVGDNPIFFPDTGDILVGANFQGIQLGLAIDALASAVTAVGVLMERRINRMLNPVLNRGLPPFLSPKPGFYSGTMITQYTAGALVCENRALSYPGSVGSIPAAADQEDFVSMAMIGVRKFRQIVDNSWKILAIEVLNSAIALQKLFPLSPGKSVGKFLNIISEFIRPLDRDRPLYLDIGALEQFLRDFTLEDLEGI